MKMETRGIWLIIAFLMVLLMFAETNANKFQRDFEAKLDLKDEVELTPKDIEYMAKGYRLSMEEAYHAIHKVFPNKINQINFQKFKNY